MLKNKRLILYLSLMLVSVLIIIIIIITAKNNLENAITNGTQYPRVHTAALGVVQIIVMIAMSLIFSISLICLIFTKGGKLLLKDAFVNNDKITIAILETVILTLSVNSVNTMIINKVFNDENNYHVKQIKINHFERENHKQNENIINT